MECEFTGSSSTQFWLLMWHTLHVLYLLMCRVQGHTGAAGVGHGAQITPSWWQGNTCPLFPQNNDTKCTQLTTNGSFTPATAATASTHKRILTSSICNNQRSAPPRQQQRLRPHLKPPPTMPNITHHSPMRPSLAAAAASASACVPTPSPA